MTEFFLKYGCNPNQTPARIFTQQGKLPLAVLNGRPGYINFLDALAGWQLVRELEEATGVVAAASFKHTSPAGAAIGLPLPQALRQSCFVDEKAQLTPLACAYARARGADRMSSYGDFVALSGTCDASVARLLQHEVSDGVIAPGYSAEALEILQKKRKGSYVILQMDAAYQPPKTECKDVFGITFEQGRNDVRITTELLQNIPTRNKRLTATQMRDLTVALIVLKYTQSNSVCYAKDGQAIGVGAGQQSRIHCTRLAGGKADLWHLRQHPRVLALPFLEGISRPVRDNAIDRFLGDGEDVRALVGDGAWQGVFSTRPQPLSAEDKAAYLGGISGVALGSDAFFPFGDNIERAHRSGVDCVAQPGGSVRDDDVIAACNKYGISMAFTGLRLFTH